MAESFVRKTVNVDQTGSKSLTFYNVGDIIVMNDGTVHVVTVIDGVKTTLQVANQAKLAELEERVKALETPAS